MRHETIIRICSFAAAALAATAAFAQGKAPYKPFRATLAAEQLSPARPCKSGFVWREAGRGDFVCVESWARGRVRQENADAPLRTVRERPGAPPQCLAGYVFRMAFAHDLVCVTPAAHAQVQDENALGPSRLASVNPRRTQ